MNKLYFAFTLMLSLFSFSAKAATSDEQLFFRFKFGPSFHSNTGAVTNGTGFGLDLGFELGEKVRFGAVASGILNYDDNKFTSATETYNYLKSYYAGLGPSLTVGKESANLRFSLQGGILNFHSEQYVPSRKVGNEYTKATRVEESSSRPAIAPGLDLNLRIVRGLAASAGFKYLAGLGESPKPNLIYTMAGLGYDF